MEQQSAGFKSNYSCIREMLEAEEASRLSPYAALSKNTAGRDRYEEKCDIRPEYQRDRDKILHCKAFRRMKHKTQVFLAPEGDHYRTRLTHTLEVAQIARTISKALSLNEDLTEAIALGHDLGHTPFGHSGEAVLDRLCRALGKDGFEHSEQSVRIVEVLEKDGRGLNLTKEVRDGILNHQTSGHPKTLEGQVVRLSDKIAYLNHDVDDAIRGGLLTEADIPKEYTDVLGNNVHDRLNSLIHDVIRNSLGKDHIEMSADYEKAMLGLRAWMFRHVYIGGKAKEEEGKAKKMIELLFQYYMEHPEAMPEEFREMLQNGTECYRVVCDYISGMTDNYAIEKFEELFVPMGWHVR